MEYGEQMMEKYSTARGKREVTVKAEDKETTALPLK